MFGKKMDRRSFLKTAALGTVAAGTSSSILIKDSEAAPLPQKWDKETDIVVIGAGAAGLMAAIQADAAGKKVLLLEKARNAFHSSSTISGGYFAAAGTKAQKAAGINDSPDKMYNDILKFGGFMNYPHLLRLYCDNAAAAYDFVYDNNLAFLRIEPTGGHNTVRAHRSKSFTGRDYIEALLKVLQGKKIEAECNSPVTRIFFDDKAEKVVGVQLTTKGKERSIKAKSAVIIATGGFSGNVKRLDNWIPAYAGSGVVIGGDGSDGEGIMMAVRDVGTPTTHMQYSATYPMGIESGKRSGPMARYYFWTPRGAIIVNQEGKRYIDELTPATKMTLELAKQPGKVHYVVLDGDMWEGALKQYSAEILFCLPSWSMQRVNEELKKEKVLFKGETIEDVAKKANIDPRNLAEAVNKYNQFVDNKKDADFGRQTLPAKLLRGPYYLVKMTFWTCLTLGGLRANEKLQVLDSFDKPIKGLYAAGEAVGGVHGDTYLFGCAFGWAHTSGWVAGRIAAKG